MSARWYNLLLPRCPVLVTFALCFYLFCLVVERGWWKILRGSWSDLALATCHTFSHLVLLPCSIAYYLVLLFILLPCPTASFYCPVASFYCPVVSSTASLPRSRDFCLVFLLVLPRSRTWMVEDPDSCAVLFVRY